MEHSNELKDLLLFKSFDIKIKNNIMQTIVIDDSTRELCSIYILKNKKIYIFNIKSKQLKELSFSKNHSVKHISGNINNQYLIIHFHNGKIFALYKPETSNQKIIYIKYLGKSNLLHNTKFKIFVNNTIDKIIIITSNTLLLWIKVKEKEKHKNNIKEIIGYSNTIQIDKERTNFLESNKYYCENFCVNFGNNENLGSFAQVFYLIVVHDEKLNATKVYLVEYLFKFELENKFHIIKRNNINNYNSLEYKKYFDSKYVYTYIIPQNSQYSKDKQKMIPNDEQQANNNVQISFDKTVIMKSTISGKKIAIVINNCPDNFDVLSPNKNGESSLKSSITLLIFTSDNYKFRACSLAQKFKSFFQGSNFKKTVIDIAWLKEDLFILIQFSDYSFIIINTNFTIVDFSESSECLSKIQDNSKYNALKSYNNIQNTTTINNCEMSLYSSKSKLTDYFIMFTPTYAICFYISTINYEKRIVNMNSKDSINNLIEQLNYLQSEACLDNTEVVEKLHNFILNKFPFLFKLEDSFQEEIESQHEPNEIFCSFIQIIKILNFSQGSNLILVSYFLCVIHDLFFYLLDKKEIWLGFMLVTLCEKYILKTIKLKNFSNKNFDKAIVRKEKFHMLFNPYTQENRYLKCYNNISNKSYLSKFRILLIIFGLMEFHNNQALSINVLYFVFAKIVFHKSRKKKPYDEMHYILKILIKNWKYLREENKKVGKEEYVLNELTFNKKTNIFSGFNAKNARKDFKFDFFNSFYSPEELQTFTEFNEKCCKLDEESLLENFSYLNQKGVIQRWMLFFTNFYYNEMFEEIKIYLTTTNRIRESTEGNSENTMIKEDNLTKLVYFNVHFFINLLQFTVICLVNQMTPNLRNENLFIGNFTKKQARFISPIDIPFIIFELSSVMFPLNSKEKNRQMLLPFDVNNFLLELFQRYQKDINMTILDGMEFIDVLISKGFSYNEENTSLSISKNQKYIYSALVFILICICKTKTLNFLIKYQNEFLRPIYYLDIHIQRNIYQILFIILNAYLKELNEKVEDCQKEEKINEKDNKCLFQQMIEFEKKIFYMIICNGNTLLQENIISEFIHDSINNIRLPLCESGIYYIYKKFKKLFITEHNNYSFNTNNKEKYSNEGRNSFLRYIIQDEYHKEAKILFKNFVYVLYEYENICESNSQYKDISFPKCTQDIKSLLEVISNIKVNDNILDNMHFLITKSVIKFIFIISSIYPLYKIKTLAQIGEKLKWYSFHLLFTNDDLYYKDKINQIIDYLNFDFEKNNNNIKENMTQIIINILYGNLIHNISNTDFLNKIENMIKKNENIIAEYDNFIKIEKSMQKEKVPDCIINSKKFRIMNFLMNNKQYIDILKELIAIINEEKRNYIEIINKGETEYAKQRKNVAHYIEIFSSLTGIQYTYSLVLKETYEYENNQSLYNNILNKGIQKITKEINLVLELLLEERQKLNYVKKTKTKQEIIKTNDLIINIEDINFRKEKNTKRKLKIKINSSEQFTLNKVITKKSIHKKKLLIGNFVSMIKRVFYHQLLNGLFLKYKECINEKDLEQIKCINVIPKENKYDILIFKEKYLSAKEFENSFIEGKEMVNINKYDILKLNKNNESKSKIKQRDQKKNESKKMLNLLRGRINELKIRLDVYEEMVNELGKNLDCK